VVAHTCDPSYLESRGREDQFKTSLGKIVRPYFKNKPGMVGHACNPSYIGDVRRKMKV
jgi:hypothetical protein